VFFFYGVRGVLHYKHQNYTKIALKHQIFLHINLHLIGSIRRFIRNTALVLVANHADVALFAPGNTPGVLDFPVVQVGSSIMAITNKEDTVVKRAAASSGQNTTLVELEGRLISLNGDRDGLGVNGGTQSVLSVSDVLVSRDHGVGLSSAGRGLASAISSSVGVSSLSAQAILHDIFEGVVHQTTVTASVTVSTSAVNKLLFGERVQDTMFQEDSTLNTASGGEGPARSALSLIFHTSNSTLLRPVQGTIRISTNFVQSSNWAHLSSAEVRLVSQINVLEFTSGEVSELVQLNLVSKVGG